MKPDPGNKNDLSSIKEADRYWKTLYSDCVLNLRPSAYQKNTVEERLQKRKLAQIAFAEMMELLDQLDQTDGNN